jgi:predicted DNA-binding protein (MmcQ/YjbR family)
VTAPELLEFCLAFPGAVETHAFGESVSVIKVGGKTFAWLTPDREPLEVCVKCEAGLSDQHRDVWPDDVRPAPYLGKHGWNAVRADGGLDARVVRDMIEDSYDLVVAALPVSRRPG